MDRPLVIFDTERANEHGAPHLLELGAVRVVEGEVAEVFEALVLPRIPIESATTAVHGIDEALARDAEPPEGVLERFAAWVGTDWMAAHDARADARVLGFEYARARRPPPPGPVADVLALAKRALPEMPDHRLDTLVQMLELEGEVRHRALSDAVHAWQVLEACLARGGSDGGAAALFGTGTRGLLTLAAAGPLAPRLAPRLARLGELAGRGTELTLLYGDDSAPPAPVSMRPELLYQSGGKGYLEGICARSGTWKTYRLDRVRRLS